MEKKYLKLNDISSYNIAFEEYKFINDELQKLPKELNQLISYTNEKLTI